MPTIKFTPQVGAGGATPKNDNAPDQGNGGGVRKANYKPRLDFKALLVEALPYIAQAIVFWATFSILTFAAKGVFYGV